MKRTPQFEPRFRTVHDPALPDQPKPSRNVEIDQLFVSDQRDSIVRSIRPPPDVLFQKSGSDFLSLVFWIDANGVNADRLPFWIVSRHGFVREGFGFG